MSKFYSRDLDQHIPLGPDGELAVQLTGRPCIGFEEVVIGTVAAGLAAIPQGATFAYLTVLMTVASGVSEKACYRVDGGVPTGTEAQRLEDMERLGLDHPQIIRDFRIIRASTATANGKISVSYF